jgi:hypothetical protein
MGNSCVTPCSSPPAPNLKSRVRCLYFCCLKGSDIRIIHTSPTDELDGSDTVSVFIDNKIAKQNSNGEESTIGGEKKRCMCATSF